MKWKIEHMVDPGDGIVSSTIIEHPSDDICEVAADALNGDTVTAENGEPAIFHGWIMGIAAVPPEN